ncbi:unnamed protein product [Aspergillus oryzae var. brunneus]|uniref:Unnamed protein product n=1 Tax=Aspergillus oryzae var. brunneus TaxID=332754 RepID=A0ABQ6KZY8_ASPOZ|nr:unnamed protein product [Aspergillus oryzae]GMG47686.1 unnamed protein product [Aspergillus oryzae var. brunneus]
MLAALHTNESPISATSDESAETEEIEETEDVRDPPTTALEVPDANMKDYDDRSSRRDRERGDLFEERPRRDGRDRDRERDRGDRGDRRERRRSASPPPRKREATPDLTEVESVLHRKRRLTQWDIKPPGYENVTAEQAKLSGEITFICPGSVLDREGLLTLQACSLFLVPHDSNPWILAKRLFVSNLPASATGENLLSFFNLQLNGLNVIHSVDPCISAQVSDDRSFALLEFKTPNDATVALAFDGITMDESEAAGNGAANGAPQGLEVRRPKDYIVPSGNEQEYQEGVLLNEVPDSPNKICVSNIPHYIPEEPVTMLLKSFGELKSFVLVKDGSTEESRYADPNATSIAVEGLNGMELGDRHLKVVRASIGITQAAGLDMGVNAMSMFAKTTSQDLETSRCAKYGQVVELKIPRPSGGSRQSPGVGKIFVKFDSVESTTNALKALAGRKFSDRTATHVTPSNGARLTICFEAGRQWAETSSPRYWFYWISEGWSEAPSSPAGDASRSFLKSIWLIFNLCVC